MIFVGVFAADTLPPIPRSKRPCAYIVNTDPISLPGQHWVVIYFGKKRRPAEYYDSYGRAPLPCFRNFINNYKMNKQIIQSSMTSTCGQHCIFYILKRCNGYSMEEILIHFKKEDLLSNDVMVNAEIEEKFGTRLALLNTTFIHKQISRALNEEKSL